MDAPQKVHFRSLGLKIVGDLYFPAESSPDRQGAAIVVSHPFTAVKEQTAGLHARCLAEHGFITLAFDAAYQGESEGEPRGLENPTHRAEDVRAAVTYLQMRGAVNPERIGVLGICASGGYVPFAAQTDTRMRAVATVSAMCAGRAHRAKSPEDQQAALVAANKDRLREYTDEGLTVVSLFSDDADEREKQPVLMQQGWRYYRQPPMQHARAPNTFVLASASLMANYDSYQYNSMISPRPLLMIVGSEADTAHISEDAIRSAKQPKELFVVSNKTHMDLYSDVSGHLPKLVDFFSTYLNSE
ncbi:hypothetical protein QQS21_001477 [Conoideocrella luteorostrata]|uniref:PET hydrolase/cutinase-like domain-containing protein n=1 Tax=Conoideocrella luteorostrata TaxID=1105319 RepID=A0AAJ0G217_9HYPO|nr:hypothetical protein QQS21_001477 [Conoideocrella luteorostrata]